MSIIDSSAMFLFHILYDRDSRLRRCPWHSGHSHTAMNWSAHFWPLAESSSSNTLRRYFTTPSKATK